MKNTVRIFLDDERFPPNEAGLLIARSYSVFKAILDDMVYFNDKMEYVSFDHDLATPETGLDCAKLLVEYDMDHGIMANNFSFYVHSQNPVGKLNIESYLNSYLKSKET